MGYRFQFITLAGFHALNESMFELARGYAAEGMSAYVALQEREFALEDDGYTATRHQREVGAGYFDDVAQRRLRRAQLDARADGLDRGGAVRAQRRSRLTLRAVSWECPGTRPQTTGQTRPFSDLIASTYVRVSAKRPCSRTAFAPW